MKKISSGPSGAPPAPRRKAVGGTPCYDSWQKAQPVPDIYLAIRYHGMPALQKNPENSSSYKKTVALSGLEKELQDKFEQAELSPFLLLMKQCIKSFFSFLFLPLYFLFTFLPHMAQSKLLPLFRHWYEQLKAPLVRLIKVVAAPLQRLWQKMVQLKEVASQKLIQAAEAGKQFFLACYQPAAEAFQAFWQPYKSLAKEKWKASKSFCSAKWQAGEARLFAFFQPLEKYIESLLKSALRQFFAPLQRAFKAAANSSKSAASYARQGTAGLLKMAESGRYALQLALIWSKIFMRYISKLAKEAFQSKAV